MSELTESEIDDLYTFCKDIAKSAGSIILEGSKAIRNHQVAGDIKEKLNPVDLVTEWDVKVENHVSNAIKERYPDYGFIGEESYSQSSATLSDKPTFIVDPIDGTTNFIHGFPFACVSIGVFYEKQPSIGVIYNPFLDRLYHARKGHGSYLITGNETFPLPLGRPKPLKSLNDAIVAVEWGSQRSKELIEKKAASFVRLAGDPAQVPGAQFVHSLRSIGSAALNYSMVASGELDLYWEIGCWQWDVCAGVVIVQEAGGFTSGGAGAPHDGIFSESIMWGRKFIVVRAIADTPEMTGREAQQKIIKDFYNTVEDWNP